MSGKSGASSASKRQPDEVEGINHPPSKRAAKQRCSFFNKCGSYAVIPALLCSACQAEYSSPFTQTAASRAATATAGLPFGAVPSHVTTAAVAEGVTEIAAILQRGRLTNNSGT